MMTKLLLLQTTIHSWFSDRSSDETGASMVEYALLLSLVAVVAIGALIFLGHSVNSTLSNVGNSVAGVTGP